MHFPWETDAGREFLVLNVALLLLLMSGGFGTAHGAVLISEVLPDPASDWNGDGAVDSRGDEWLEVVNTGPDAVDLADYWIRDALGDAAQMRLSGTLAPGAAAVFYGSDAEAWQQANGVSLSGLSLNNAGDELYLSIGDPAVPGSSTVDGLIYPAHVGADDRSLARFLPENEWVLCDAATPYGGDQDPVGTGCPPTPGEWNACAGLVPDAATSWGAVKADFR